MNTQSSTAENAIAILRQTTTVSFTFVEKPGDGLRQKLKDAGYKFENGQWYRSQTQGQHAGESLVAKVLAA